MKLIKELEAFIDVTKINETFVNLHSTKKTQLLLCKKCEYVLGCNGI